MLDRRNVLVSIASSGMAAGIFRNPLPATAFEFGEVGGIKSSHGEVQRFQNEVDGEEYVHHRIDTNVTLFRWPFRRLPLDSTVKLHDRLRGLGMTEAWAGSFEGVFHRDLRTVNQRLVRRCERDSFFRPLGSVNLSLPDWKNDLMCCIHEHRMTGIRLHPNYHQYNIRDQNFHDLIRIAASENIVVQIAVALEDTRTQNPLAAVPDVDLAGLELALEKNDGAKVQLLNCRSLSGLPRELTSCDNIFFDTSRMDSTDGLARIMEEVPADRILYGSHAPLLITEAALIRVHESNLSVQDRAKVLYVNALRLSKKVGV